jgi:drug/metabolite transporter (DMT)-like permease
MPPASPHRADEIAVALAPALFVLLWSTGFVGAKFGLPYAEPLTFLALRFALVTLIVGGLALATGALWPRGAEFWHNVVSGLLLHGLYLSGVFIAIHREMPAGIAALIVGLQPLLTSTLASRWLGEWVWLVQWLGLAIGLIGLFFVIHDRFGAAEASLASWIAILIALFGVTVGTIYQKKHGGGTDLRSALTAQFGATFLLCGAGSLLLESRIVHWSGEFVFALAWLSLVLSCGAIFLFYWLIRRTAATRLVSLFYLVPPVTALMSYALFGELLSLLAIAGMVLCIAGVALVNWNVRAK